MISKRKMTALIIDDSAFMRSLIKNILYKNGYRVVGEAENGKIGAEKYKILRPDFVTTDVVMDEANGIAALELIMGHDPGAKVIVVSSMITQKPVADEALSKGAKALVPKPVDENILIGAILNIM
jgi:two-component system chemotaxis response regulator CheY